MMIRLLLLSGKPSNVVILLLMIIIVLEQLIMFHYINAGTVSCGHTREGQLNPTDRATKCQIILSWEGGKGT